MLVGLCKLALLFCFHCAHIILWLWGSPLKYRVYLTKLLSSSQQLIEITLYVGNILLSWLQDQCLHKLRGRTIRVNPAFGIHCFLHCFLPPSHAVGVYSSLRRVNHLWLIDLGGIVWLFQDSSRGASDRRPPDWTRVRIVREDWGVKGASAWSCLRTDQVS